MCVCSYLRFVVILAKKWEIAFKVAAVVVVVAILPFVIKLFSVDSVCLFLLQDLWHFSFQNKKIFYKCRDSSHFSIATVYLGLTSSTDGVSLLRGGSETPPPSLESQSSSDLQFHTSSSSSGLLQGPPPSYEVCFTQS